MATVRITEKIRKEVSHNIEMLFDARLKKKYEELQHLDVAMQVFMRRISREEFDLAQKLNAEVPWVNKISTMLVRIEYASVKGVKRKKANFSVRFESPVPAPLSFQGYNINDEKNIVDPSLPCYQPCVDVLLEFDRMIKERDTLRNSIDALLSSCSTLRQVLEKWPTALDFMPDEVKEKHAEKVEPTKKKAKIISEVDDRAKMLLMKARMLNGA